MLHRQNYQLKMLAIINLKDFKVRKLYVIIVCQININSLRKKIRYAVAIFSKSNWMLIENYLSILGKSMDSVLSHYNHLISIDNINSEPDEIGFNFVGITEFKTLIKLSTCLKNFKNFFITERASYFWDNCLCETGEYNFHRVAVAVLRVHY